MDNSRNRSIKQRKSISNNTCALALPTLMALHITDEEKRHATFGLYSLRAKSKEAYAQTVHICTGGVQCNVDYTHSDKLSCLALFKAPVTCQMPVID